MKLVDLDENIRHCWRCNHCKWVHSPQSNEFAHACPSIQYGQFHSYSGGGKVITAHALATGAGAYTDEMLESVFACTMCGACDVSCKINNGELVEPLEILYALRERVAEDGKSLPAHRTMQHNLTTTGNPFGKAQSDRARWADGLNLKNALAEPVDVLLHVGCDMSYSENLWPELRAIVALLRRAGVDFGIASQQETPSGELAFDLGFTGDAADQARALAALFAAAQADTIVTCSAGSFSAIRSIWPRLGVATKKPAHHITDFVEALFADDRLSLQGGCAGRVTYHDPCKLGRLSEPFVPAPNRWTRVLGTMLVHAEPKPVLFGNGGTYDAPRRLLQRLPGIELVEMERNRVASYCCGAKGGAAEAFPDFAAQAANRRLDEAEATGAAVMATACGGCQHHLGTVAKAGDRLLRVVGLFELLAGETR